MIDGHMLHGHAEPVDGAMAAFVACVLADQALQARLGGIEIPDAFVAEALAIATAHGIALDDAAVRAAIRPDPLGVGRFMAAPVTLDRWPGRGWLPARSVPTGGAPAFDWAWFGPEPLDAPFFEDSVRRFAPRPFSQMFRTRTTMDALLAGGEAAGPVPSGFVYHMSRCGSTLVAQMLGTDPRHVVLSEPEPLDAVVRWALESGAPVDVQVAALRAVVSALGRDRSGETRRVFVKLDSWHTAALPLLRAAFPETPWVFLTRDPVEVLVSQLRQHGIHTVAGMLSPTIIDVPGAESMDPAHYAATAIARFSAAVLDHWSVGGGMLVDYRELPDAVSARIAPHFALAPDAVGLAAMAAAGRRDAKDPTRDFASDSARKRQEATPAVEAFAEAIMKPLHDRLDVLRRG